MKIICIAGKARHGKDTAAEYISEELTKKGYTVLITHYGDLLKYICRTFFGWNGEKDERGRHILQYVGTDIIRAKAPDYWVNFIADMLEFFKGNWNYVIIPDCRFPNEIDSLKKRGLDVCSLKVIRDGFKSDLTEEQLKHASETALDNYSFEHVIHNGGSLEDFHKELFAFVEEVKKSESKNIPAKEKMIVFRCKYCIEDLKEYNPYINEKGQGIPLENIICIEVPKEICENTTFESTPILLNKEKYLNLPEDEQIILLDRALKNATNAGYEILIRIWEDQYARDEGLSFDLTLGECTEDFDNPSEPAEELLYGFEGHYNRHGCAEIVARKGDEECYFYHEEYTEKCFLPDLFDFIIGGSRDEV